MNQEQKRPRTLSELKDKLQEQIDFLKRSADSYDEGREDEAIRLAVSLRILLHDSKRNKSLLGQLNKKNSLFLDSATTFNPQNKLSYEGLICIAMLTSGPRYVAMLDDVPEKMKEVNFENWWNNTVFVDKQKRELSRKNLVLIATNQDGGAHVDSTLNEIYAAISKDSALGWVKEDQAGVHPIEWAERAAIRQIAHEVLKYLIPGYTKKPKKTDSFIVGQVSLTETITPIPNKIRPVQPNLKIGRNELCPCGSRKKYKKCHGR